MSEHQKLNIIERKKQDTKYVLSTSGSTASPKLHSGAEIGVEATFGERERANASEKARAGFSVHC